ncbi:hypothetical protein [Corynebacterium aquatimens]|uniref:hypothetical protein n=1 Tax=Corynebacterium aquatimens TaxID=1190508 RepID=UPI003313101E
MSANATLAGMELPTVDDILARAHVVALPMAVRFRGVTTREALLIDGPAGWGEFSPSWSTRPRRPPPGSPPASRPPTSGSPPRKARWRSTAPSPPCPRRGRGRARALPWRPHVQNQGRRKRALA